MSELTVGELARLYGRLADHVASDEATTYTDDRLFVASCKLKAALTVKVDAAAHIRGIQGDSPNQARRRRWRWLSR